MINLKRLKLMRAAGRTIRFHTMPSHHKQTVGEHTFGAMAILRAIYPDANGLLYTTLLEHDAPEPLTGDIPSNVKWRNPNLVKLLDVIEGDVSSRFDLMGDASLSETERRILKYCDWMELVLFAVEEYCMGNRLMARLAKDVMDSLHALQDVTPKAQELYTHVNLYCERIGIYEDASVNFINGRVEL